MGARDDKAFKTWVSEQLHSLLGFSERAMVDFVASIARKHSSAPSLASALASCGLPAGQGTAEFASQLLARLPRGNQVAAALSAAQEEARQVRALLKKNATYALLDDPEPAAPQPPVPAPADADAGAGAATVQAGKHSKRQLRRALPGSTAASGGDDGDGAPELAAALGSKRQKRHAWEEEDDGDDEGAEARAERLAAAARERDQQEKRDFEERLRSKDEARTKKLAPDGGLTKAEQREAEKRKYDTEEERKTLLPTLRGLSRQEYLKKREDIKLDELRDELEDAKYLFDGVELTAKEKADLAYKQQVYDLAMQHKQQLEKIHEEGYRMPDSYDAPEKHSARFEAAMQRYKPEEKETAGAAAEQEAWEAEQLARTKFKAGAADAAAGAAQYDYLFEDAVEFLVADVGLAGEGDLFETAKDAKAREAEARAARERSERERLAADRASLPIFPYREQLLAAVAEHQIVIIVAETGAGKTTQLPQYLHEAGYSAQGKIGCTQPRRVAAMSVSARVAQEMGVKLGNEVGYSIRFEDCTSDKTLIKYMTDGMLLREFLGEPDLASYSVMMIDEAHERTLHTDVLFGLVKDVARFRPDLKLLISSATLDAEKFSEYFDYAPIFRVPGRRYPVDILYTKAPEADYIDAAVVTTLQIHATQPPGDILVFLTGQEEIEACEELLKQRTRGLGTRLGELILCPIYANLPSEMQAKIFEQTPPGARKVVLATNIAETSLTIDGIKYVIDPGFSKQNSYNPRTGMESLVITPVSKASANQRAGRAGRTSAGKCFRLYTAWSYENELEDNTVPEIQRTNLGNVVLMLKSLGIHDLMNFDFMDPPPAETLLRALEALYALGALNDKGELTKLGRRMAEFPLDPQQAKTLLASETYGVAEQIATICSMVSVGASVYYRPKDKQVFADNAHRNFCRGGVGDHIALLHVYDGWAESGFSTQWCFENYVQVRSMKRARDVRDQLVGLMERVEIEMTSDTSNHDGIRKAIAAGFFYNTARLQKDGTYKTVKNPQTVHIHPSSSLKESLPRWVVYQELVLTSKEYMRVVSEIRPDWLVEIAPHFYSKKDIAEEGKKLPKGRGLAPGAVG